MMSQPAPVIAYPLTLTNVGNTAAKTAFLSFAVPAMSDGDILSLRCSAFVKQNHGSAINTTFEVAYGSITAASALLTWANDASEYWDHFALEIIRSGNDAYVNALLLDDPGATSETAANLTNWLCTLGSQVTAHMSAALSPMGNKGKLTGPTFTSSQTVEIRVTFSQADALLYIHPISGFVHHMKVG